MFSSKILNKEIDKIINDLDSQVYADRQTIERELKYFNELLSSRMFRDKTPEEIINELFNCVIEQINSFFEKYSFVPGINVTSKINDVKVNYSTGYTNYTKKRELDIDTLFDVASISKTPTAILMYKSIEEQLININDKVKNILYEFKNLPNDLVISNLLQYKGRYLTNGRIDDSHTKEEAANRIKEVLLENNSLDEYNYNDIAPILCGIILERVNDKRLDDLLTDKILKPLKLSDIKFNNKLFTNNITGTPNFDRGLCNDPKANVFECYIGSAGLFSSTNDMISIMENLLKGDLFKKNLSDFYTKNEVKLSRAIAGQSIVPTKIEKKGYFSNLSPIMSLGEDGSTRTIATSGKYVLDKTNYYVSEAIFTNPCSSNPKIIKYYENKNDKVPGTYYKYFDNIDVYRIDAREILPSSSLDDILFSLQKFNLRVSLLCAYVKSYEKDYDIKETINIKSKELRRDGCNGSC